MLKGDDKMRRYRINDNKTPDHKKNNYTSYRDWHTAFNDEP